MHRYLAARMEKVFLAMNCFRQLYRRPYLFLAVTGIACASPSSTPCERFFEPYPDLVTGTARTAANAQLLDAMTHYTAGEFEAAVKDLQGFIETHPQDADRPYLYLANCYLALGKPYDAELQLDFLERWPLKPFRDEIDWYNALCMVCSDQLDRALEQAQAIATAPRHTYRAQAQELVKALAK